MFPNLIYCIMDYPNLFHLSSDKLGFYHPPSIYLIVHFQSTHIVISELLTDSLVEYNFISQISVLIYNFFCPKFYIPLISKVTLVVTFPRPLPVRLLTVRLFCDNCFPSCLPNDF